MSDRVNVPVVWCVGYRGDGWCATATGRAPLDRAASVLTLCDHYITLHHGGELREPNCADCLASLRARAARARRTKGAK